MSRVQGMWASLAFRDFRLLWLGSLCSNFAMQMQMVARGWLIYDMTRSPMALQSSTFNLSRILGPAIAGALIALLAHGDTTSRTSVGIVFFIIAGLYAASILCTSLMHHRGKSPARGTSALADLREGIAYMRRERLVLGLIVMGFVPMTFGFTVTFLMPAFNADVIGGGPDDLGLLLTAAGMGALAGSLGLARAGDFSGKGRVLFLAGYLWALFVVAFALSNSLPVAMLFAAGSGFVGAVMGSLNMSVVQLALPDAIRGRVMSIMMMAHGFMPIAIMPISGAAEHIGIHEALTVAGICLGISMVALRWWLPELARIDRGHRNEGAHAQR